MIFKCICRNGFALLSHVPKTLPPAESTSWLRGLFERSKRSPTFLLLKQLFQYLQEGKLMREQFALIAHDDQIQQNWMIIHAAILKNRLSEETSLTIQQLEMYNYNLQVYFFPDFARYLHKSIPTERFQVHFSQAYFKKYQVFLQVIQQQQSEMHTNKVEDILPRYNYVFRQILFENRVRELDHELVKFSKYYIAHNKYLRMLSYEQMIHYKVKWGFQEDRKLLYNFNLS